MAEQGPGLGSSLERAANVCAIDARIRPVPANSQNRRKPKQPWRPYGPDTESAAYHREARFARNAPRTVRHETGRAGEPGELYRLTQPDAVCDGRAPRAQHRRV